MSYPVFRFGSYLLDPAARELTHDGERVAVPPKSFDCLAYLVQNRGRAVGRDELISAVWGRADVNDALLAQTLLRARRAVGDDGNGQNAIRTVPRFGYRWIAATEQHDDAHSVPATTGPASDPLPPAAPAIPPPARPQHTPRIGWLFAGLLAALLLIVTWKAWQHAPGPIDTDEAVSGLVVVAPVKLIATDVDTAWIRLGVMDFIASRLREHGHLTVLPSQRVAGLVGEEPGDASEARARLIKATGASRLIEPDARRENGRWHVRLLVHTGDRQQVVDGDGDTPLAAAGAACDALLDVLDLTPSRTPPLASAGAPDALGEAIQRIDAAMLAGNLAGARAELSGLPDALRTAPPVRVREAQVTFRSGGIDDAATMYAALEAHLADLPVDVQAQALMGLGAVGVRRGDFAGAERRYAEALAVLGAAGSHGLSGDGYSGRGVTRAAQGKFDLALGDFSRARIALERAGDIPGVAGVDVNLGLLESRRGRWPQALEAFDRAVEVFQRYGIDDNLAASLLGKGRAEVALVDPTAALATSARAAELARNLENPVLGDNIAELRTDVLLRTGALSTAAALLDQRRDVSVRTQRVDLELARGHAAAALALARADHAASPRVRSALRLVRAAIAAGAFDAISDEALAATAAPDATAMAYLELARALWAAAQAQPQVARDHFERALVHSGQAGSPDQRLEVISRYIAFLVATNELDRASELAGQIAAYADRDYRAAHAGAMLYRALGDETLRAAAEAHEHALVGERVRSAAD